LDFGYLGGFISSYEREKNKNRRDAEDAEEERREMKFKGKENG
jgi:hypothetical protein